MSRLLVQVTIPVTVYISNLASLLTTFEFVSLIYPSVLCYPDLL